MDPLIERLIQKRDRLSAAIALLTEDAPASSNGQPAVVRRRPRRTKAPVDLSQQTVADAVLLTLHGLRKPIRTPELVERLEGAGVQWPSLKMPRTRFVGMMAARLVQSGHVEKTPDGWKRI